MTVINLIIIINFSYILGIIIGLYFKKNIALIFFMIFLIYIVFINLRKTRRYINIILPIKKFIVLILTIIISSGIIIFNEKKFDNIYKNNEQIETFAIVLQNLRCDENYKTYKIKIDNKFFILRTPVEDSYNYGDFIHICGRFQIPRSYKNHGTFYYYNYLKSQKIYGNINADQIKFIKNKKLISKLFYNINFMINKKISNSFKREESSILKALILGNKDDLSDGLKSSIKENGLSHIIAISGMHVECIIIVVQSILNIFTKDKKLKKILILIIIIFYSLIIGFKVSAIRAIILSSIGIVAQLVYLKKNDFISLNFASFLILLYNPYCLFDSGFILSFSASIGVLYVYKIVNKFNIKNMIIKYFFEIFLISICVIITVLPLMIFLFKRLSITFLVTSLLITPIIFIIEFLSILFIISPNQLLFIFKPIIKILIIIFIKISNISLFSFYLKVPSFIEIILYYLVLFLILNKKIRKSFRLLLRKCIYMVLIVTCLQYVFLIFNNSLKIYFIDVGQGDSTLIVTPRNKKILIDGGGDEKYDIGKNVLIPFLLAKKIDTLDYVIVSHFDTDHVGGLLTVMEELNVKQVIISKQGEKSDNFQKFKEIAYKKKIKVLTVEKGDRLQIEKDLYLDFLWPNNKKMINTNRLNNNSIVCKLCYKKFSIIFTGDIEEIAEKQVLQEYRNNLQVLNSIILKVAHHGSKTSSIQDFIKEVEPEIALIGVGENNKFGHPSIDTINKLNKLRMSNKSNRYEWRNYNYSK